jgi:hypothetical protein
MVEPRAQGPPESPTRHRTQVAVLVVLIALIAFFGWRSVRRVQEYRRVEAVCSAVDRKDWAAALADPRRLAPTVSQLREADCRCVALLATDRDDECEELAARLLAEPGAGDWLPRPDVMKGLISRRFSRGDIEGAAALARRAALAVPDEPTLVVSEAVLTAQAHAPRVAIAATRERLFAFGEDRAAVTARITLGALALDAGDWESALEVIGDKPPAEPDLRDEWYRYRMTALARAGRPRDLQRVAHAWAAEPDRAATSLALYALLLSTTQQRTDADGVLTLHLLAEAVRRGDEVEPEALLGAVYSRFVGTLAIIGQREEALRLYDEAVARFPGFPLDRDDLTRTMSDPRVELGDGAGARMEIRIPRAEPGMQLIVSPEAREPRDVAWPVLPVPATGIVTTERTPDTWPFRWVLRDAAGQVRGSGGIWPTLGGLARATAQPREIASTPAAVPLAQAPSAGRSRLFVVILDCGDWRFVQYGRARGEMPSFEALLPAGRTTVLASIPPFTAAAMQSIVQPGAAGVTSVLGLVHHLGSELQGLSFVTRNPAEAVGELLPQGTDLFVSLGAGDLKVANLLHSYGRMQVGRNGATHGPRGAIGQLDLVGSRAMRGDELAVVGTERSDKELAAIAGDFDDVIGIARQHRDVDLVMLRVAALDLMTHGEFPATAQAGQDDGGPLLFGAYRYIDRRLGELYRATDGNDVLLVMSDHGANTALEHHPHALFIAAGGGVEPGRIPGTPDLRGIPRMIAEFFGVPTDWPDSGLRLPRRAPPSP